MCILSFTKCLNELDRIMVNDVYVGDIVRTLEDVREYVETYYKVKDKNNVIEIFSIVNYILGNIEIDYVRNNHLNQYKQLRMLIRIWRWYSFNIDHHCVRGESSFDDDNVEEGEDKEM